jgi:hypothetical protein
MNGFIFDEIPTKNFIVQLLVPFFVTLFFLQGFRTYVVNIYISFFNILWEGTGNYTPLLTLLVFGAPLLGVLVYRKVSLNHMILSSAILTSIFVIPISLELAYEFELLFSSLVVAFYAIFLPFYVYSRGQDQHQIGQVGESALLATAFILAFSFDILFRGVGTTSDISRTMIYFPLQLLFSITVIGLIIWKQRQSPQTSTTAPKNLDEETGPHSLASRIAGLFTIAGIGAFLFLEHSLLMNPHNLLRRLFPTYNLLDMAILTLVGLMFLHTKGRNFFEKEKWYTLALSNFITILLFAGFAFYPTWFDTYVLIIINIVLLFNLYYLLQFALHPRLQWSPTILCLVVFLAFVFFLLWDFLFAFSFTYSYLGDIGSIFAGQTSTIILSAAIILGIASSYAVYTLRRLSQ